MSIELIHGDCMDYLATVPDKAFDLAIVDPPYGINVAKRGSVGSGNKKANATMFAKKDWDKSAPGQAYFDELRRVSKNQIIWGSNHFISRVPIDSSCWIVWNKDNGTTGFADCELAWTSFKTAVRMLTYAWDGFRQGDMKNKETRIHPTQKPVKLYEWLLHNYAKPGQRILDTHLGSGSSAIAAHYFGCDFVGIEKDEDYFNAAKKRFELATAQTTVFDIA